jgi:hypothetical protein
VRGPEVVGVVLGVGRHSELVGVHAVAVGEAIELELLRRRGRVEAELEIRGVPTRLCGMASDKAECKSSGRVTHQVPHLVGHHRGEEEGGEEAAGDQVDEVVCA